MTTAPGSVLASSHGPAAAIVRDLVRRQPRRRQLIALRGWILAVFVYVLAVFHRSSLGVAGLQAEHRFGIGPGQLSVFVMLQIGVYAAMQIPTGVLVDRFGPRRLLVAAAALMGLAQIAFALVPSFPMALLARALLGCGDALTFVSVLRFASVHFAPRRFPIVVAATGMLGALGNVVSTVPLSLALQNLGWAPTFTVAGSVSLVTGVLIWFLLPVTGPPPRTEMTLAAMGAKAGRVGARVRTAWTRPGTRLGFWLHFATMSATTSFGVLWGLPYLVNGLGFTATQASETLLVSVLVVVTASPLVGLLTGRHPAARVPLGISVCLISMAGWFTVLALPPDLVPDAAVVALVAVMAVGAPASAVAFALARDYNRPDIVGTASGVVNVGGFSAVILASLLMGVILDVAGSGPGGYRLAMVALLLVQLVGTAQLVRWWRVARADVLTAQHRGDRVPVRLHAHRWDLASAGADHR
jgi:MFS family permease